MLNYIIKQIFWQEIEDVPIFKYLPNEFYNATLRMKLT